MAVNKIRIRSGTEYVIEVNDAGETISFDLADTSLPSKLFKMMDRVEELTSEIDAKAKEIDALPDKTVKTIGDVNVSQKQMEGAQLMDDYFIRVREALDIFLGEGACQKIFGDKNYYSMVGDLMEQLEPHFKKIGLTAEQVKKAAVAKHAPNRAVRRTMS
jgi:hypothetical protein